MWKYINKLQGKEEKENEVKLFGEDGREIEKICIKQEIDNFWSTVYTKHDRNITNEWNEERKTEYEKEYEEVKKNIEIVKKIHFKSEREEEEVDLDVHYVNRCRLAQREHFEMAFTMERGIINIHDEIIIKERVRKCLKRMKCGKTT